MFLRDIRKSEPLSSAEEHELWCQMRQGCQRARSKLIYANLRYVDTHRKQLQKQYPVFETFKNTFEVPQDVIDQMLAEAAKDGVKPKDDAELQKSLPSLRLQMKALVARDLSNMDEYFSIMNEQNDIVMKAIQLLQHP